MDQQISSKDSRGRAAGFKSISEHAGVSPSTVDRVLNERGGVSRSARAKVLAAARELGVKRILPPAINGIVQVNLVVPNLGDFYVGRWSNAVNQAARQLGANVRIELLNWSRRDDRLLNHALVSSKRNARFPLIVVSAADDVLSSAVKHKALKKGSPPLSRTLTRRPIEALRSVHVEAKEVQYGVQARCG